jgi:hypothetical protein
VNEVVNFAKRVRKECLILKVDFEWHRTSSIGDFWNICLGDFGFVRCELGG